MDELFNHAPTLRKTDVYKIIIYLFVLVTSVRERQWQERYEIFFSCMLKYCTCINNKQLIARGASVVLLNKVTVTLHFIT